MGWRGEKIEREMDRRVGARDKKEVTRESQDMLIL
jgi:hypothetical protein